MDKLSKPLRNIVNVLGRTDKARLGKTEDVISAYPSEIRKFEKGTSVKLCSGPKMESEGNCIDVLPAKSGSVDSGNDFQYFGHSQNYGSKDKDILLFGVEGSHGVTLPHMTVGVQGLSAQDIAQSIETVEEGAPLSLNNTKFKEDSSLQKTENALICMTASVKTKKDCDENTANCNSASDKINTKCVLPTSLTVLELDRITMSASQEESGKYSLNNCVSEQEPFPENLADNFSLQIPCKMEAGSSEIVSGEGVEQLTNEKKPMNSGLSVLTSDAVPNILGDSNKSVTDGVFVHTDLDAEVQSVISEIDDYCSNTKTTEMHLKPEQISGDSSPNKNARKNDIVSCPLQVSEIGNELSAGNCPDQNHVECIRKAEIKNEILAEREADVTSLTTDVTSSNTQCELSDEQDFRTKTQQVDDSPLKKNEQTHAKLPCSTMVSDTGNKLSAVKCPDQNTVECNRNEEIKSEILTGSKAELISLKTHCELFDEQNFNTSEKEGSSKTDCLEGINQTKFAEFKALASDNVKNHDTAFKEAKNNEKFKLVLSERDELSPWEWKGQFKSSTPCQKLSKIICEDEAPEASEILSTPKVKRNVNLDTTKGKKIDFTEIVEDQNKDFCVKNSEKLPANHLEDVAACNKTENFKIVPNIKQVQENPLKLSETSSCIKSKQMKRPTSPESRERGDCSNYKKKKNYRD